MNRSPKNLNLDQKPSFTQALLGNRVQKGGNLIANSIMATMENSKKEEIDMNKIY